MSQKYIISLDQGTTSSRAVLFNDSGEIVSIEQKEFTQHFPKPGWVEHDALEIWNTQWEVFEKLVSSNGIAAADIAAVGITNQRETTVVWDRKTGEPIMNAIVWQDRRTSSICDSLKADGLEPYVKENTGLVIDAYFSGTKLKWILDNVEGAREKAERGELLAGTIDTWLIWKLSEGRHHVTDPSNASRTMLYNIKTHSWDEKMLGVLGVPVSMLPELKDSSGDIASFSFNGSDIPISGVAGDQQSALFGQICYEPGMAKNTYGTGCFLLMNTGENLQYSESGLLTTVAWGMKGKINYALEGSVFIAGAAVQWLRDGIGLIESAAETEKLALEAKDSGGVYMVPAFAGLGTPYWDMYARGGILGLTRDTSRAQLVRATLESLAYQTGDVLDVMQKDSGIDLKELQVDGGACANNFLMQFQADILNVPVVRPKVIESTAQGAAFLAGIAIDMWDIEKVKSLRSLDRSFSPEISDERRTELCKGWQKAVKRCMAWEE